MSYVLLNNGKPIEGFGGMPAEFSSVKKAEREAKRRLLLWLDKEENDEGNPFKGVLVEPPPPLYSVAKVRYEEVSFIRLEDVE